MNKLGLMCLLSAVLAPIGTAGSIVIGTADAGSGNSFPFGGLIAGAGTIYQQVYAPAAFTSENNRLGPIYITSVHFYRTQYGSPADTITDATYTLKLSYTTALVNTLNTTDFAANVGAGQVTIGTYAITSANDQVGSGLDFEQNVSDFFFIPDGDHGRLLLEIDLSNIGTRGTSYLDAMNGDAAGFFSRADDFGDGFRNFGLVTGFGYRDAAVPEPATLGLIGTGLLGVAFLRGRRYLSF